jgi:hypothetical protein
MKMKRETSEEKKADEIQRAKGTFAAPAPCMTRSAAALQRCSCNRGGITEPKLIYLPKHGWLAADAESEATLRIWGKISWAPPPCGEIPLPRLSAFAGRCGFHSGGQARRELPLASAYRPPPPPSHSLARSRNDRKATTIDVRIRLPCSRRLPASFASGPPGFHPDRPVPNRNNTVALDLSVRALLLAGAVLTRG